jgi:simple sugar transport system substrate-binding protein
MDKGVEGGSIVLPNDTAMGNIEVNNRVHRGLQRHRQEPDGGGKLDKFKVDAGAEGVGRHCRHERSGQFDRLAVRVARRCRRRLCGNNVFTPALAKAVAQTGNTGKICAYGFDLGPAQQEALASGDLTGALGQQPFLQGFWPVMQLYLQIDRGISAANLDTRAQLVTKDNVGNVGKRFEN